jgi:hypothetical protein
VAPAKQEIETAAGLYESDFNLWVDEQVALLEAGAFQRLDLVNLIEEIRDMAQAAAETGWPQARFPRPAPTASSRCSIPTSCRIDRWAGESRATHDLLVRYVAAANRQLLPALVLLSR